MDPLNWPPIAHHITRSQEPGRLCDGQHAADADIPTSDIGALQEARAQATLCPTCQLNSGYPPFHLWQSRYRATNRTAAHLYTVPVLTSTTSATAPTVASSQVTAPAGPGTKPERG